MTLMQEDRKELSYFNIKADLTHIVGVNIKRFYFPHYINLIERQAGTV